MTKEMNVKLFENKKVRSVWDEEQEKESESVTNCNQLKMQFANVFF